jgi:hypothetical protein
MKFKTANRTLDELKTGKQNLDEMFAIVKGANGSLNRNAIRELDAKRYEIAEVVIQLINDVVTVTDPTPYLVDSIDGTFGKDYVWQELDATLRIVNRSYGTKPLSQRLTFKEYGMSTSHKELAVEIPLEEVAIGRITPSQVVDAIAETITRGRIYNILTGIDAGVTSGADHTGKVGYTRRYTGLTADNLDKALDGLLDESESPTIFGRHIALAPAIRAFTGWSQSSLATFEQRGMIGTYHGAPIVTLRDQYHKREGGHLIPSNRVYIASGTKGAKYMTKDVSFLDWAMVDPRSSTFGMGTRLEDGLLVFDAEQYRIIEVA